MPIKLSSKIKDGKFVLECTNVLDLAEVKKLWLEGKSAQYINELAKSRANREKRKKAG